MNFGQVTSRHTEYYRQNTMHMSPACIRTGGLKKTGPDGKRAHNKCLAKELARRKKWTM